MGGFLIGCIVSFVEMGRWGVVDAFIGRNFGDLFFFFVWILLGM